MMPLCFEVTINDDLPILAGLRDLKVLTAIVILSQTVTNLIWTLAAWLIDLTTSNGCNETCGGVTW
jgi:hypothetical protein